MVPWKAEPRHCAQLGSAYVAKVEEEIRFDGSVSSIPCDRFKVELTRFSCGRGFPTGSNWFQLYGCHIGVSFLKVHSLRDTPVPRAKGARTAGSQRDDANTDQAFKAWSTCSCRKTHWLGSSINGRIPIAA